VFQKENNIENTIRVSSGARHFAILRTTIAFFEYRWLIFELVKREVKLRYRGTWLGFLWTMLNPLIMTAVYTLVFQFFLRFNIPDYSAFLFCALLPYNWFSESLNSGTNVILDRPGFIRDAVFPSQILPVCVIATSMMNYVFAIPILFIVLVIFKITLGWALFSLPIIMFVQFVFTLGIVFILATYNVFFRDLRYIVQNILMALFFVTPIMYDVITIPERFQIILKINPLTQIIYCYRDIFLYSTWPNWERLGYVLAIGVFLTIVGIWAFESHKESFAENL
jgi:lipopolysaccharide transport system permease protein